MWFIHGLEICKYDGHNVEPVHTFLSGSGGTSKSDESNIQHHVKNIALSL